VRAGECPTMVTLAWQYRSWDRSAKIMAQYEWHYHHNYYYSHCHCSWCRV